MSRSKAQRISLSDMFNYIFYVQLYVNYVCSIIRRLHSEFCLHINSCKYSLLVSFRIFVRYKECGIFPFFHIVCTCLYTPQWQDSKSVLNDYNKSLEAGYNLVEVRLYSYSVLYFVKYIHCVYFCEIHQIKCHNYINSVYH